LINHVRSVAREEGASSHNHNRLSILFTSISLSKSEVISPCKNDKQRKRRHQILPRCTDHKQFLVSIVQQNFVGIVVSDLWGPRTQRR